MCDDCGWEDFLEEIYEMISIERYDFAFETLDGIYDSVNSRGHCTDRQKEAVVNIHRSKE